MIAVKNLNIVADKEITYVSYVLIGQYITIQQQNEIQIHNPVNTIFELSIL